MGGFYGGGMGGGPGGSGASAFTSPGIDPQILALLMRMQGGAGGQQPGAGAFPAGLPTGGGIPGMPGGPQMPAPPQAQMGGHPMMNTPMGAPGPQQGGGLASLLSGAGGAQGGGLQALLASLKGGQAPNMTNQLLQGQSGNNLMQQWGVSSGPGNPYFSSGQ